MRFWLTRVISGILPSCIQKNVRLAPCSMNNHPNVYTVSIRPSAHRPNALHATLTQGIELTVPSSIPGQMIGFTMQTAKGNFSWLDKRGLGVKSGNKLVRAGFYLKPKEGFKKADPVWRNIGLPFQDGYPTDREVLLLVDDIEYTWTICSLSGQEDSHWGKCRNYPPEAEEQGECLIRIPDGAFLCIKSEGVHPICILNIGGHLSSHRGNLHPNAVDQANAAAEKRLRICRFQALIAENNFLEEPQVPRTVDFATGDLVEVFH